MLCLSSKFVICSLVTLATLLALAPSARVLAQRDDDGDFDDSGYEDGNNNNSDSPSRDADESNQNPSNYSPSNSDDGSDLDDDDDTDESAPLPTARQFYDSASSVVLTNVRPLNAELESLSPMPLPSVTRTKRSTEEGKRRLKRYAHHKGYIGPVYTYVKTDKHARFKWGVKHKVGKKYGRR